MAAELAAAQLDLEVTEPMVAPRDTEMVLRHGGVSEEPIPARPVYFPVTDGDLSPGLDHRDRRASGEHTWEATVDVVSGEPLEPRTSPVDSDDLCAAWRPSVGHGLQAAPVAGGPMASVSDGPRWVSRRGS